jgi:Gas vesicle synthesis protein GvpL/GvpF
VIHLYAFTGAEAALPELAGIGGAPVEGRAFGAVAAVVGSVAAPPDASRDAVRHGLVTEALVESVDAVLPARFGEAFRDESALAAAVEPQLGVLAGALARVSGCVEVGVRILREQEVDAPAADGSGYMRARLAAVAGDEAAVAALHRTLSARAQASVAPTVSSRNARLDAAYLVRRTDVDEFGRAVRRYADEHPGVAVLCTGPWAPYSFVGAA